MTYHRERMCVMVGQPTYNSSNMPGGILDILHLLDMLFDF